MTQAKRAAGLLAACALTIASQAHAARPLMTDDTGVVAKGQCEVEAVTSRDKAEGLAVNGSSLQLACGVAAQTQLSLATSQAKAQGVRVRGTLLAAKTLLVSNEAASWGLSGGVLFASEPGQSQRHAESGLSLLHTRQLSDTFVLHANLGHARDERGRRAATTWGLALEHAGWGPAALMAELHGDDLVAPWWNTGVRWTALPERLVLDIAYGRQIAGGRPSALSAGLKLSF